MTYSELINPSLLGGKKIVRIEASKLISASVEDTWKAISNVRMFVDLDTSTKVGIKGTITATTQEDSIIVTEIEYEFKGEKVSRTTIRYSLFPPTRIESVITKIESRTISSEVGGMSVFTLEETNEGTILHYEENNQGWNIEEIQKSFPRATMDILRNNRQADVETFLEEIRQEVENQSSNEQKMKYDDLARDESGTQIIGDIADDLRNTVKIGKNSSDASKNSLNEENNPNREIARMRCMACGTKLPSDAVFCSYCGQRLVKPDKSKVTVSKEDYEELLKRAHERT